MKNNIVFGCASKRAKIIYHLTSQYTNAELLLFANGFKLVIESSKLITKPTNTLNNLIVRAIYIFLFNKQIIPFKLDSWLLNDANQTTAFYSLIKSISIENEETRNKICDFFSKNYLSSFDKKISCLFNFVLGEKQQKYIDKFRYYWSSFNAYCSSISNKNGDTQQLEYLVSKRFKQKTGILFRDKRDSLIPKLDLSKSDVEIKETANSILKCDNIDYQVNNVDAFLLVDCGYYYRNKYFHGEKTPPLVSFSNSKELDNLKRICGVLQKYLILFIAEIFK